MNEERELVQQAARDFAQKEVLPELMSMEVEHKFPTELVKRMGALGFSGWPHPKSAGGSAGDWVSYGLIMEEIAKVSTTLGVELMLQTTLCSAPIVFGGTQEQIDKYVKPVFEGKKIMAVSATEPVGVAQWWDWAARAKLDEATNEWVIDAHKIFTTGAGQADIYVVNALTAEPDNGPMSSSAASAFIVPAGTPGCYAGHIENKLGWNGSSTGAMNYEVRVPAENIVGKPGEMVGQEAGAWEPLVFGPMCLGAAEGAYERALAYVKQRKRDGGTLYSTLQVVRHSLANMWLRIEQFRSFVFDVLDREDRHEFDVPQAFGVKIAGAELMQYVGKEATMICGGQGVITENRLEQVYRDGLVSAIGGGSSYSFLDLVAMMVTGDGPPPGPPTK
ncbi:MAG: acyl-CoA dehydrogenase family protein [Bifidobacteriaceae bacterium]|nr:acyl-CoA dehydrogenase family protein [Bifidobacteriaceae bacterium]